MMASTPGAELRIELIDTSQAGAPRRQVLSLPPHATVLDALVAAGLTDAGISTVEVGVFGRRRELNETLATGDRVELYRPLLADPKLARRTRVRRG